MGNEGLYLRANNELEENKRDEAIWTKAITICEGDEEKAKYKYVQLRVEILEASGSTLNLSKSESSYDGTQTIDKSTLLYTNSSPSSHQIHNSASLESNRATSKSARSKIKNPKEGDLKNKQKLAGFWIGWLVINLAIVVLSFGFGTLKNGIYFVIESAIVNSIPILLSSMLFSYVSAPFLINLGIDTWKRISIYSLIGTVFGLISYGYFDIPDRSFELLEMIFLSLGMMSLAMFTIAIVTMLGSYIKSQRDS